MKSPKKVRNDQRTRYKTKCNALEFRTLFFTIARNAHPFLPLPASEYASYYGQLFTWEVISSL